METSDGNLRLVGVGSTGMRNCARMVKYENLSCGKSVVPELVTHLIFRNLNTLESRMETSEGNLRLVGVGSTWVRNCVRIVKYLMVNSHGIDVQVGTNVRR